jgi:Di-haem oxidoreductase, putative peroxidase
LGVARETRISGPNGDPLANLGGPLLQQRAINLPGCPLKGEVVPREATFVSLRLSTPLFGAGLIEAIPEATILQNADPHDSNGDGISGRPNRVSNPDKPEQGGRALGRFGWKAQVATLHQFAGDAYLNEMGITNPSFPEENRPQGQPMPPRCDTAPACANDPTKQCPNDLEDDGSGVTAFENFMKFLAPLQGQPALPKCSSESKCLVRLGAPSAMCRR